MPRQRTIYARYRQFISSPMFFWGIVAILVLQAVWIALIGLYPMAFDENFHLGIIRLYASHISPFWAAHPENADGLSAVARDPSYLYHWLMSFQYRLISLFTQDQTIQVIVLRLINIVLFAACLPVFRKLLLTTGASKAVVHLCLLLFVLVPVTPLVAAQINYDNLFMPLTALILLLCVRLHDSLTPRQAIDIPLLARIVGLGLLLSLVKYAFLPILMGIFVCLIFWLRQAAGGWAALATRLVTDTKKLRPLVLTTIVISLLLAGGLAAERYGYNVFRYHSPTPDCGMVLDYDHCKSYGPWARDYYLHQNKTHTDYNPLAYGEKWLVNMWFRLVFAVGGPASGFQTHGPLLLPAVGTLAFSCLGVLALVRHGRYVLKTYQRSVLLLLLTVTVLYVASLWLNTYMAYIKTNKPVAINGRYLLPILPFVLLVSALAVQRLFRGHDRLKLGVAAAAVLCMLWGGGAMTYILRSNESWNWPYPSVQNLNRTTQRLIGPLTPGYNHPSEFIDWVY